MMPLALPMILLGATLAQGPHPQGVDKIVLDMNVESVSLLGKKLYRTPAEGDALKGLEAALVEAEKNVAAQPDDPAAHADRAKALGALWRYHDAAQAYTRVIALLPQDAEAYSRRGNIFIAIRLFDQAKMDYEQATAIAPQDADNWIGLGIAHYLRQKFPDAERAFAQAAKLPLAEEKKTVVGFYTELVQRRQGKAANPDAPMWAWMKDYVAALDKLLAGDKPGAAAAYHAITDDLTKWPWLTNVMAEADLATIEGTKKMKPVAF